jgi:hypothetical protein
VEPTSGTFTFLRSVSRNRGRCYDHNFLRFSTIFGEKLAFFSKNNVMIKSFAKTSSSLSKKTPIFLLNFSPKIFKKS